MTRAGLFGVCLLVAAVLLTAASSGCNKKETEVKGVGGKKLTLTVPKSIEISQGQTAILKVTVERTNFDDAVNIVIKDLPAGVSIKEKAYKVEKGETHLEANLQADAKAAPVEKHTIGIEATGGSLTATETTKVTIKAK